LEPFCGTASDLGADAAHRLAEAVPPHGEFGLLLGLLHCCFLFCLLHCCRVLLGLVLRIDLQALDIRLST